MPQIVLIGPIRAGKSSVAEVLSRRIGLRNVPLDLVRWGYYYSIGYDRAVEADLVEQNGHLARFDYWKPFEAHAVTRVLADYPDAIIDFGAGHSVYEDPVHILQVEKSLQSADHVILLLPAPDIETSLGILVQREDPPAEFVEEFRSVVRGMLESPCNARFATATVYTQGHTLEETCAEVEAIVTT